MAGDTAKEKHTFLKKQGMIVILMVIQLLAVLGLEFVFIKTGLLPIAYQIVFLACIAVLNVVMVLTRKKKIVSVIFMILSVVCTAVIIYGIFVISKVDNTLKQVKTETKTEVVSLSAYVLKDDPAESISDLKDADIGYLSFDDAADAFLSEEEIQSLGMTATSYDSILNLADALADGTEQGIILNDDYISMVEEQENYEDFGDLIKSVYEDEVEIKIAEPEEKSGEDLKKDTFTVYISGIDMWGAVNARSRSDVNILAIVNTATGHVQLINTPRDYYVYLPDKKEYDKLTHAGLYGIDCSKAALEKLYGTQIDYYIRVNFSGFESIIEALGGINVYSEYDFTVEGIKHYTTGYNYLNGFEALNFARERHSFSDGDVQRGRNQMEVIKAIIKKITSPSILANYRDVLEEISACIMMDIPSERIYNLVRYELATGTKWTVDSYTVTGTGEYKKTYSMPDRKCFVMIPDKKDVAKAKKLMDSILSENQ